MDNGYSLISSIANIGDFMDELSKVTEIGLDTESTGLDIFNDTLLLLQVCTGERVFIFDVQKLGRKYLEYVVSLIKESNKLCIAHNAKYDAKVLRANTDILLTNLFDTMVAENVLTTGLGNGFPSLAELMDKYLDIKLDKDVRKDFIGAKVITQEMLLYAALDVKNMIPLKEKVVAELTKQKLLKVAELENKLQPVVAEMEYEGVLINTDLWTELTQGAYKKVEKLGEDLRNKAFEGIKDKLKGKNAYEMFVAMAIPTTNMPKKTQTFLEGITDFDFAFSTMLKNFNFGSPNQLLKLLQLNGVPTVDTNSKNLDKLKTSHELVRAVLEFRPYLKKVSSFGEDYLQKINTKTGRLHANFNQLGTSTGRWSSDSPNLQQIPRQTEDEDSRYRNCFIARPGYKILTVDYNQAELRLLGAVAGEPKIIKAYQENRDIHRSTGANIYHVPYEDVTKDQRWKAKQVNFAVVYGSTEYGLYYNFGISIDEGRTLLADYFNIYTSVRDFVQYAGEEIWKRKYSITPYGRKRFFVDKNLFTDYREANRYKASVMRKGVNMIIQGGSADILKLSLIDIFYNNPFGLNLKILMTVHDEGVFEVKEELLSEVTEFVVGAFENNEQIFLGEIPAKADYVIKDYWSK